MARRQFSDISLRCFSKHASIALLSGSTFPQKVIASRAVTLEIVVASLRRETGRGRQERDGDREAKAAGHGTSS